MPWRTTAVLLISSLVIPFVAYAEGLSTRVQARDEDGVTALMRAARDGERDNVTALLEQGVEIDAKDAYGWTALIYAAGKGDASIVEDLLEKGADVNAKDENGYTPLMAAARDKHHSIIKLLLAKGADVNSQDKYGATALTFAARGQNNKKVIELLEQAGAMDPKQGMVSMPSMPKASGDTRPVPLNRPEASYTTRARENRIEGTVRVRILIGRDGTVKKVRVIMGLPYGLSYQAMDAAYQLRFKPATKNGEPTEFWQPVDIDFHLRR